MVVLFKNSNDEYKEYTADVLTDIENIEAGCLYIDVTNALTPDTRLPDWKQSHIQSVNVEEIICFANNLKAIALEYPKLFI